MSTVSTDTDLDTKQSMWVTKSGASTPYKRWSKCTLEKVRGEVLQELRGKCINSELDSLLATHSDCHCVIGGDFNTDLNCNVNASVAVNNFISSNNLCRCDTSVIFVLVYFFVLVFVLPIIFSF